MFGNSVLKREEWLEIQKILGKYKIGYTASYEKINDTIEIKQVQIDKIDIIYSFDDLMRRR